MGGGGQEGGNPGIMGAEGGRRGRGRRGKWQKFRTLCTIFEQYFATGKAHRGGNRECRVREAGSSDPPVPPPPHPQEKGSLYFGAFSVDFNKLAVLLSVLSKESSRKSILKMLT